MQKLSFLVVNLPLYKRKMQLKYSVDIPTNATFFDVIANLDRRYWNEIYPNLTEKDRDRILLFPQSRSLLQTIWNPQSNHLYSDVMFEARADFSNSETLPIFTNFDIILPEGADITLGPDQGC